MLRHGILGVMSDVTQILSKIESGDPMAADQLLPLVYQELRKLAAAKMAHEKPGQTLQATALVHEAYLRLVDVEKAQHWNSRGHFFAAAAEAMRRILVEKARSKRRVRRGGEFHRINVPVEELPTEMDSDELLALNEALEQLKIHSPIKARLVVMHFFGDMTLKQVAQVLGVSRVTAHRYWLYARAWLFRQITENGTEETT